MGEKFDDSNRDALSSVLRLFSQDNEVTSGAIKALQTRMNNTECKVGVAGVSQIATGTCLRGQTSASVDHDYVHTDYYEEEISFKAKTKEGEPITVFMNRSELPGASTSGNGSPTRLLLPAFVMCTQGS